MKNYTKAIKSALTVLFLGIITQNVNAQNNTLNFDGADDSVTIPYNVKHSQILSIQFAIKPTATNVGYQTILTSAGNYTGYTFYIAPNGTLQLFLGNGTNWVIAQGPAIAAGAWTNIAAVYNGPASTITLYVNGVAVVPATTVALVGNATFPMKLGAGEAGTPSTFFGGDIDELSLWKIQLTPAQITFNMNNGQTLPNANLIAYYNFNEGVGNGNNAGVTTLNDGTSNGINGTLYNFALNNTSSNWVTSDLVLPINLINFSGSKKGGSNLLQWSTASEQNSSYFEVQRSENSIDFTTIAKVNAAGNSSNTRNYQYNDDQISSSASIYYYRLKMVDIDGSGKYSSVIFIKNSAGALTTVYPNPARDQITINVANKSLINTEVLLSGLNGKVLQKIFLNQTSTQVNIGNYAKGMYILKFADGSSIKIVKE